MFSVVHKSTQKISPKETVLLLALVLLPFFSHRVLMAVHYAIYVFQGLTTQDMGPQRGC